MTYSLSESVNEVLDTTDLASPGDIAGKVAENVPSRQLRTVLGELLPAYVREKMRAQRAGNPILADAARLRSARSPKVAAIREQHVRALRDRVFTADGWKLLGECSYDDLMYAASARREDAERNLAKASQFESLAAALQHHHATTVAELPADTIREAAAA